MRVQCIATSRTAANLLEAGKRSSTRRCKYQATHQQRHFQTRSIPQRQPSLLPNPTISDVWRRIPDRQSSTVLRTSDARRTFSTTLSQRHGDITPPKPGEERRVTFIDKEGHEHIFEVADGDNLLDIAQANDLEMEGACGGSCACSTCHVIVQEDGMYDKMVSCNDTRGGMIRDLRNS